MVIEKEMKLRRNEIEGNKSKSISTTKECESCHAAFLNDLDFEKHLEVHFSRQSLVCYECGADFANPLVLETHLNRHQETVVGDFFKVVKEFDGIHGKFHFNFLQLQVSNVIIGLIIYSHMGSLVTGANKPFQA